MMPPLSFLRLPKILWDTTQEYRGTYYPEENLITVYPYMKKPLITHNVFKRSLLRIIMVLRVCRVCNKKASTIGDLENFVKNPGATHGRQNICTPCHNEQRLKYYHNNKDSVSEYARGYRKANREKITAKQRIYRANNPEATLGETQKDGRPRIPRETRIALLKRANYDCEHKLVSRCKGVPCAHHVDGDPWNNELSNLQLLCQRHHHLK